ncbi:hypothetical protein [Spirillospora sp. NPDC047279]|uniref:hypothetical protein n=1 Tax=Spirillospora sp. NPDC047279 TaxID=3155478 RepID=UPI0033D85E78
MTQFWEYLVVTNDGRRWQTDLVPADLSLQNGCNEIARDGWELVSVAVGGGSRYFTLFFKRPRQGLD